MLNNQLNNKNNLKIKNKYLTEFIRDLYFDLQEYKNLKELLKQQFIFSLKQNIENIENIALEINKKTQILEKTSQKRVFYLRKILEKSKKSEIKINKLLDKLPINIKIKTEILWQSLEDLVIDCKYINQKNCEFIMKQFEISQNAINNNLVYEVSY